MAQDTLIQLNDFGGTDADSDPLLFDAFEDHSAFQSVLNHERQIVLGRKGSGKTAIFRQLLKPGESHYFAEGHIFTDYPWHHHAKQKQEGVPEEQCYVQSWEYLINIGLSKILLNKDNSQPYSDESISELAKLERFVIDTYGARNPDVSQLFEPARELDLKANLGIDWKVFKASLEGSRVTLEYLPIVVQEVNRNLSEAVMRCANPECNYYICFDELDVGFSSEDSDFKQRLIGLLLAAKKVNNNAAAKRKSISVVIFLRDDIFNVLRFEDKNKIYESMANLIEWDKQGSAHTLKTIMERRFARLLNIEQRGAWEQVFNENELMTNKQSKYAHMRDRTLNRPRDIIKFCNEVLTQYQKNGQNAGFFCNKEIADARDAYSGYFYSELEDELPKHLNNFEAYFQVLKEIGASQFEPDRLEEAFQKHGSLFSGDFRAMDIAKDLFNFSIIAFLRPGGGGYGGSTYVWKHKEPKALFNDSASSYRIHPGLIEYLGIKKFEKTRSS